MPSPQVCAPFSHFFAAQHTLSLPFQRKVRAWGSFSCLTITSKLSLAMSCKVSLVRSVTLLRFRTSCPCRVAFHLTSQRDCLLTLNPRQAVLQTTAVQCVSATSSFPSTISLSHLAQTCSKFEASLSASPVHIPVFSCSFFPKNCSTHFLHMSIIEMGCFFSGTMVTLCLKRSGRNGEPAVIYSIDLMRGSAEFLENYRWLEHALEKNSI